MAQALILEGKVRVDGHAETKAGRLVPNDADIEVEALPRFVSRGGEKLEGAFAAFTGWTVDGLVCLDVGSSTGGFTDLMLKNGAAKVFAVDVGHDQLAESLRNDERVVNLEGTDIRNITADDLGGQADFVCADVSFISLTKILPKIYELMKEGGCGAVLIKPQFEAGRKDIGKHGIVKDRKVHIRVLEEIDAFASSLGFVCEKYTYSPIKGGSGNIEYLVKLCKGSGTPVYHDFRELTDSSFIKL